ncbi:hypothetical protein C3L33_15261, partial [Rhododendron williamsianum]
CFFRAFSMSGEEEENAAELKIGDEFLKAKCLMNCEVAIILEHKYEQLQQMADDPMNQVSQFHAKLTITIPNPTRRVFHVSSLRQNSISHRLHILMAKQRIQGSHIPELLTSDILIGLGCSISLPTKYIDFRLPFVLRVFEKSLQYVKRFSRYKNPDAVRQAREYPLVAVVYVCLNLILSRYQLAEFETTHESHYTCMMQLCVLGNLCPETVEEAIAMVPSMKSRGRALDEEAIEKVLNDLSMIKKFD